MVYCNFSVQVGVKATLGVPRYSGIADVVCGVKALSTRAKDTAPSDVSISMLTAAGTSGVAYGRVRQLHACMHACMFGMSLSRWHVPSTRAGPIAMQSNTYSYVVHVPKGG